MIIGEDKSMVVDPRDSIRRLNNIVRIRPYIPHGRTPSDRLELLNCRICANFLAIKKFTRDCINGWTMVDEEDTQRIGIHISSNIYAMEIQNAITVNTREALDGEPMDARGKGSRVSGIDHRDAVVASTTISIEMVEAAFISWEAEKSAISKRDY